MLTLTLSLVNVVLETTYIFTILTESLNYPVTSTELTEACVIRCDISGSLNSVRPAGNIVLAVVNADIHAWQLNVAVTRKMKDFSTTVFTPDTDYGLIVLHAF